MVLTDQVALITGAGRGIGKGVSGRLAEEEVRVRTEVLRGDVAEEIIDHARHCDLVIMSTHGRSGLGRWVYGSIADRTLRYATVPVLLVRAGAD